MKVVHPIRNEDQLNRCFQIAKEKPMHYLLLLVGCNTGLRISDLSRLKVREVRHQEYVRLVAQKTGKDTRILLNGSVRKEIARMTAGMKPDDYLFKSRQRDPLTRMQKPISRQRAYQIINKICRAAGVQDRVGDHTLRKTFGYWYYKQFGDVVSLQRILGHSNQRDTLRYIGIQQDEIDENLKKFKVMGNR